MARSMTGWSRRGEWMVVDIATGGRYLAYDPDGRLVELTEQQVRELPD